MGLELTATPFVETSKGAIPFKKRGNRLSARKGDGGRLCQGAGRSVTRKKFQTLQICRPRKFERLKLEDGVRLPRQTKVQLETYARENGEQIVKPLCWSLPVTRLTPAN